jgi:DNA-binding MarR family transcriptional regulator
MKNSIKDIDDALNDLFTYLKSKSTWKKLCLNIDQEISRPGMAILHVILKNKGSKLKLNDLATLLDIEAPFLSRKTKELEESGYIHRFSSPLDRREIYFEATQKAIELEQTFSHHKQDLIMRALAEWSEQDKQQFSQLLKRFLINLRG